MNWVMEHENDGDISQQPKIKHKAKHDKPKPWDDNPNIDHGKINKFDLSWNETGMLEVSSFSTLFPGYREKHLQEVWPTVKSTLTEEADESRLREVCESFLGPPTGMAEDTSSDSRNLAWDPCVLGLRKHKLLREDILPAMASNRKVQRLLNEFMDLLSEYENADSNVDRKNPSPPSSSPIATNQRETAPPVVDQMDSTPSAVVCMDSGPAATVQKNSTQLTKDQAKSAPTTIDQVNSDSLVTDQVNVAPQAKDAGS